MYKPFGVYFRYAGLLVDDNGWQGKISNCNYPIGIISLVSWNYGSYWYHEIKINYPGDYKLQGN